MPPEIDDAGDQSAHDIDNDERGRPDGTSQQRGHGEQGGGVHKEKNDRAVDQDRCREPPPFAVGRERSETAAPSQDRRISRRICADMRQHEHRQAG